MSRSQVATIERLCYNATVKLLNSRLDAGVELWNRRHEDFSVFSSSRGCGKVSACPENEKFPHWHSLDSRGPSTSTIGFATSYHEFGRMFDNQCT